MFNQTMFTAPTRCLNRLCKAPYYKESFRGWRPGSSTDILVYMKCSKCRDVFEITQFVSMVPDYLESLKSDPAVAERAKRSITESEQRVASRSLDNVTSPFATLFDGTPPEKSGYGLADK